MRRLTRFLQTLREDRRTLGWRGLVRQRGWTLIVVVIVYYVLRDTLLYILLPLGVAAGITH